MRHMNAAIGITAAATATAVLIAAPHMRWDS